VLRSPAENLREVLRRVGEDPERVAVTLDERSEPLIAFSAKRRILHANPVAERLFGYGRRELDSRSTDDLVPARLRQPDAPSQPATEDVMTVELPGRRKDGAEVDLVWTFGSVAGAGGPIFVLFVEDRSEATALATEAQFRMLVDMIPVLAWYVGPDTESPWFNQRWFEYTGTKRGDPIGWAWQVFHDPGDLPRIVAKWKAALGGKDPWEDEFRLRRHDGAFRWFLSRAVPLLDPSGRVVRWFGVSVDIHDRRLARERLQEHTEAELHASEERFHQLVDAISDYAVFMLDRGGHVVTWNPGAQRIKGYRPDEILGQHFSVFYTVEDREQGKPGRVLETVLQEGRFEEESWRLRKDGSRFWANVVITALRDQRNEITGFAKVTRDLTLKREAEEKKQELLREQLARAASERASRELERVSRAKDEFLATMSHELRTPLNAIQGWATLLQRKPREEDKLERGLDAIERNARAQTKLINDLLDVSRIITGKLRLSLLRTDLVPLLSAAADVVKPAADAKGVRLVVDIDPSLGSAMADSERIQQIMWNLLTNAVSFTPRGGRVTVTGQRGDSAIVIRVQDTGRGIAREHLPHVFERFMQVDSSTTRSHGGLGLGLSIVRHLVEAHGGVVEVTSEGLGKGAAFTVTLPVRAIDEAQPDSATAGGIASEPPGSDRPTRPHLNNIRVLIVEDDPSSLDLLSTVLASGGARVTAVASAREALEALDAGGSFDLVVSDIGMPEMDGYALIRRIRALESGAHLPAIALTAYARSEDAEKAIRAGYQEHLSKPIEESRLLSAVRTWSQRSPPSARARR
jgi:PAS domain S-box-containing protein